MPGSLLIKKNNPVAGSAFHIWGCWKLEITGDGGAGQPGHHEDQKGGPRGRSQAPFPSIYFIWLSAQMTNESKGSAKQKKNNPIRLWLSYQCCGSGSESGAGLDPDSIEVSGSVYFIRLWLSYQCCGSESGSGFNRGPWIRIRIRNPDTDPRVQKWPWK